MNSIVITGRITRDLELKTSESGKEYMNFSVAVDRSRKDKNGNRQTDFFRVGVFGKTAAFVNSYFGKGDGITIAGRMESDKYTDKNGIERTVWTLMADQVEFPLGKSRSGEGGGAHALNDAQPVSRGYNQYDEADDDYPL